MDFITIFLVALLITIAFIIWKDPKQARIKELLGKMPGPPTTPLFGNGLELITSPLHELDKIYTKRNKEYGPIFRTWRGSVGEVNINSAEGAEVILNSSEHITKSEEYFLLQPWLRNCLFLQQGQIWRNTRKIFSPAFSTTVLDNYIDVFSKNSEIFLKKVEEKAEEEEFNICPFLARYTLDIVCETTIGIKVDAQNEKNMSYVSALHDGLAILMERHTTLWLGWDFTFNHSRLGKRFRQCISNIHHFVSKIVQDGQCATDDSKILHNDLYNSEVRKKKHDTIAILEGKLREEDVEESVNGLIFAGHDTTYVALSWAVQLLGEHPDVQEKAYEELEQIFGVSDRAPTKQDLQDMKYLERVIKETLRLYPSAPAVGRTLKKEIEIEGYTIPSGVSIWIQIYFIHRNPKYYSNPEEFNPDNFLPEKIRQRHPYAYIPFSAGPRNCMGQKYAMLEMKALLSCLIRKYKIRSLKNTKDLSPVHAITLTVHEGVYVTLTPREKCKTR